MKKVYLHIGYPKTGTTTIQETLFANRDLLLKFNYLYPFTLPSNHSYPFIEFYMPANFKNKYDITIFNRWDKSIFLDELKSKKNIENLIISGENLITFNKEQINKLMTSFKEIGLSPEYKIICFIREPVAFATSLTQQRVRTLKTKVVFRKNFIRNHLEPFIEIFGINNINIIKYEDAILSEHGITGAFLNSVGLPANILQTDKQNRINQSMSSAAYEIINFIISVMPFFEMKGEMVKIDINEVFPIAMIDGKKFELSVYEKTKIAKRFNNDVKWLKDKFNIYFDKKLLNFEENNQVEYNEEYIVQLKTCLSQVPDKIRYLIYIFVLYKEKTAKSYEVTYFQELHEYILHEYKYISNSNYSIRKYDKTINQYHKIQKSKYPNMIF